MQAHAGNLLERPLVRSRIPGDMSPTVFRMLTVRTLTMIVSSFLIVISLIDVLTRHAHCIQKASLDEASGLGKFSGESAEIGENFGSQNGSDTNPTKSPNITDSIIYRNGLDYYKTKNNEGIYKTNREQMFFRGTTSNDPINCDKTGQRTQSLIAQFEFKHIFQIIAGVMAYTGSQKAIANWLLPILVLSTFKTIRLSADTAMEITTYLHKYLAESGKDDFMKSNLEAEDGGPPVVTTRFQYDMNYNRNASLMTIFVYICQMILVIYVTYIIWSCYRHLRYLELRDRYGNSLEQHANNRTFLNEFLDSLERFQTNGDRPPPSNEPELDRDPPKYEDINKSEQIAMDDMEIMDLPSYNEISKEESSIVIEDVSSEKNSSSQTTAINVVSMK